MFKVKIRSFFDSDSAIIECYNKCTIYNDYVWKDLRLVLDDDYDFLVISGTIDDELEDYSKCILIQAEPYPYRVRYYRDVYLNFDESRFFRVYDINRYRSIDWWVIELNYQQLVEINASNKHRLFSGLISGLDDLEGHKDRLYFLRNYLDNLEFYDSFLVQDKANRPENDVILSLNTFRGVLSTVSEAYVPYKYVFQGENFYEKNYFTEKIIRSILCECLTFYSGCPNVEDFIDPRCYIKLNLKDPEESVRIIKESIENNEWEKRLPYIRKEKYRLMNDENPLEIIRRIIHQEV